MSKFPDPLRLPHEVPEARARRYQVMVRSAFQGISIRLFIALIELIASLVYGSASLFMDALSTALDIGSSLVLILSFKLASRPPDQNHPFGHGRFEPLAGLQLGLFFILLGGGMFYYNTTELAHVDPYTAIHHRLWLVPFFCMILLEICYRSIIRTARITNSPALAADAVHYRIDSITSGFALIALVSGSYSPQFSHLFDRIGASLIALFMIIIGANAAWKNLHQILDRIPAKDYFDRVRKAACRTAGVKGTEKLRMQLYGPDAHVDIDIEVDPYLTIEVAHEISQKVRLEIQKELPEVQDVIVHIEPYYPNDH